MDARYVQSRLSRRELLEMRRAAHEAYLRRRTHWWSSAIAIVGSQAILRRGDGFELSFPATWLFTRDLISRLGI